MKLNIYNDPLNQITLEQEDLIEFPYGIPGFEDLKKYAIVPIDGHDPFKLLHSVENMDIALILIESKFLRLENEVKIPMTDLNGVGAKNEQDIITYVIVKISDGGKRITGNTRAPIVVNSNRKKGRQLILDRSDLAVDHLIAEREN